MEAKPEQKPVAAPRTKPVSGATRSGQAAVLVFGRALSTLADALIPILIVRFLAKDEVGRLSAVMILYATSSLVLTMGFPAALFHFVPARERAERAAIARHFIGILLVIGLSLGAGMLGLGLFGRAQLGPGAHGELSSALGGEALVLFSWLALYPLGDLPSRVLPNLLVIEERSAAAAGIAVCKALGTSLVTLVPIVLGCELPTVLACWSAFGLLQALLLLPALRWLYGDAPRVRSPIGTSSIFRFAIPLGLTDVVSMLNNRFDRYLIGLRFPLASLADYQAGAWQVPVVNEIPYAVGRVYASDLARLFAAGRPREAIALWRSSIPKVAALVVPLSCVFIIAAEECMELLFTSEYAAAADVFRCYAVLTMGRVAAFGSVIVAAGKPRLVLVAALFTIASNAVISIPLLYGLGFIGPALGTALAFIPMVWFYCWCIARASGLRTREIFPLFDFARVLGLALLASLPAVVFKLTVHAHPALVLAGVFAVVGLCFGGLATWSGQVGSQDWKLLFRYVTGRFGKA